MRPAAATLGGVGYGTGSAHRRSSPHLKTLEMLIIPGAAYKATCRVSTAILPRFQGFLTIDGIVLCCERQSVS
jgi:hypothetical protein